ncbi:RNA polymerase sigma factor, partial [Barnesiella intestinihominis]|uniref:RNA polymerase sigma factor n=1 Tax=Barnesiella intestinihominis TaxID=487174 RepID=UPI002674CBDB
VAIALRMVGVKDKKEIEGKLNKLLSSLTGRQREIIYLRFIHELEYEEIASLMHMTIQSSRKAVSRAIGKMRKLKVAFLFIIICLW